MEEWVSYVVFESETRVFGWTVWEGPFLQTRVLNKMTTLLDQVNIQGNKNGWILFIDGTLKPSHEVVWGVALVWRGEETQWEGVGLSWRTKMNIFYVFPSLFNHGEGMVGKKIEKMRHFANLVWKNEIFGKFFCLLKRVFFAVLRVFEKYST